jgi:hypothetical protein
LKNARKGQIVDLAEEISKVEMFKDGEILLWWED